MRALAVATLSLFGFAAPAIAADPPKLDPKMEEAMKRAAEVGPEHRFLAQMAGQWTSTAKTWMAPGGAPMEHLGTSKNEMVLGDRFLSQTYTGQMAGQGFTGLAMWGYDNTSKKFVTSWADSMNTGLYLYEGTLDKSGKIVTSFTTFVDPMTKKKRTSRSVMRIESPERHVYEMYGTDSKGKEYKTLEIVYSKTKSSS